MGPPHLYIEIAERVEQLVGERFGRVAGMCLEASLITAAALEARGDDVRVVTGLYVLRDQLRGKRELAHAHAEVGRRWILDPTRRQFEDAPLVVSVDAPAYGAEEDWDLAAPPRSFDAAAVETWLEEKLVDVDYHRIEELESWLELHRQLQGEFAPAAAAL